jgi:hypothetical protein
MILKMAFTAAALAFSSLLFKTNAFQMHEARKISLFRAPSGQMRSSESSSEVDISERPDVLRAMVLFAAAEVFGGLILPKYTTTNFSYFSRLF